MGLSKAARNRVDEHLIIEESQFELRLRAEGRPLLSDGSRLRESELVTVLTGNGIAMDRAWLWKLTRQFPSAESLADWLIRNSGICEEKMTIHVDWVWIAVDCLWDRWCPDRPRFESLERMIQEGYVTREFDITETCRMWLLAWKQMQWLYSQFRFDSIDDFDDCLAGAISVSAWAQDLLTLLKTGAKSDPGLLTARLRVCEEFVEHCEYCYCENRSAELAEPMKAELEQARRLISVIPVRRAA
ncbi:MAG: hypothetical protein VB858_14485 [Planctomycetaceae bacterium]